MGIEQSIQEASSRDDAIKNAAYELRSQIAVLTGDLADTILDRPEVGTDEWQNEERARLNQQPDAIERTKDWHLVKVQITIQAKLDPTGDVINAKRYGATWQAIADTCGISRQAAFDRWAKVTPL